MGTGNQATTQRTFVSYIDRTREFYAAQGYDRPYRWAHFDEVPFTAPTKPLSTSRVGLVTTASDWHQREPEDGVLRGAKPVWSGPTASPPERLYTDDLAWDKQATHTDDVDSFLPIRPLEALVAQGRVGSLSPRFYGVPTDYSQRRTMDDDAPEVLRLCREDQVDVVLLSPL
jgi:hypothetical protein